MVNGIDRRKISATRAWGLAILITAIGEWAARCHQRHQLKTPLHNLLEEAEWRATARMRGY